MNPRHDRDGFALPVALLAMIVIGAILTGGFYVSSQEHQVSMSTDHGARALHVAQYGLEEALGTWTNATIAGASSPVTGSVAIGGSDLGTYRVGVLPLGNRLYAIESEGVITRGGQTATRRVGSFVRLSAANAPFPSAISVLGQLSAEGNATISGQDQCAADQVAGVTARNQNDVTGEWKNPNERRIHGLPPIDEKSTMDAATLMSFGEITLDDLIESAAWRYTGDQHLQHMAPQSTTVGGATICDVTKPKNWGDPSDTPGPCGDYYPIVYVDGNLALDVGVGQGVLIVNGNLTITGNIIFSGIMISTGTFLMEGTGNKVNGTVIALGDSDVDTAGTSGNTVVQYNSCKIREALNNNLRVRPLANRSWFTDAPPLPVLGT
jgi:hypothetical protein